ncbi:hypothetical protein [Treponema sp.]|uniref:hypothetical protein n=1 Tax=Treponema sp. TaxID=166 RepID=UPI00388D85C2
MKRNRLVAIVSAISLTAGILFTSCHDNIYALIEKEVAIDNSGLNGDISRIVRSGNHLFLANGRVYGKENKPLSQIGRGNWKSLSMPVSGSSDFNVSNRVDWLAADDTYVYALASFYEEDDNGANDNYKRQVYAADASDFPALKWQLVEGTTGNIPHTKIIFDNQASSGRNAYVTLNGKVCKLSGTTAPTPETISSTYCIGDTTSSAIMNCVKFKGKDYFSKYYALTANDTFIYYTETYTSGSTNSANYADTIYYTDNPSAGTTGNFNTHSGVLCLTLTKDYLFYGTTGGLERTLLDAEKKPIAVHSFGNNGNSVISEHVYMVYAYDQNEPMANTDLYCASTIYASISSSSDSYENIGLYACPAGSDWNRDGD